MLVLMRVSLAADPAMLTAGTSLLVGGGGVGLGASVQGGVPVSERLDVGARVEGGFVASYLTAGEYLAGTVRAGLALTANPYAAPFLDVGAGVGATYAGGWNDTWRVAPAFGAGVGLRGGARRFVWCVTARGIAVVPTLGAALEGSAGIRLGRGR